jgi:hypothetical protein
MIKPDLHENNKLLALIFLCVLLVPWISLNAVAAEISFSSPIVRNAGATSPGALRMSDFNGDNKPDIIVVDSAGTGSILLGNGDGTFKTPVNFSVDTGSNNQYSIATGDFNKDGKTDVVTINNLTSPTASIYLGNGDGTLQEKVDISAGKYQCSTPNVSSPFQTDIKFFNVVAASDINDDGKLDIVTADDLGCSFSDNNGLLTGYYSLGVLLGNGDGTFQNPVYGPAFAKPFGIIINSIAVKDLNGDEKPDIAVTDANNDLAYVFIGDGSASYGSPTSYQIGSGPIALALSDVNGDGKPELLTTNNTDGTVSVLLGKGDGTFGSQQTYNADFRPVSLNIEDMSGDGIPDMVVANHDFDGHVSTHVGVLLGNGDGTFQPRQAVTASNLNDAIAALLTSIVGDANGDGVPDIVVLAETTGLNGKVGVLLGQGTPGSSFLTAPTGVVATAGNGQVIINWTASIGAVSYNVYQGTTTGGESANAVKEGVTGTGTTITGLSNGTTYYFTVAAVNSNGTSAQSYEVRATPASIAGSIPSSSSSGGGGAVKMDSLILLAIYAASRRSRKAKA